jgi:hypothetical protein
MYAIPGPNDGSEVGAEVFAAYFLTIRKDRNRLFSVFTKSSFAIPYYRFKVCASSGQWLEFLSILLS